jgi:predicted N-acetyltransferase YhbS
MPDMLVPLLKLPPLEREIEAMWQIGVTIRRANVYEITPVLKFIRTDFSQGWADETGVAFANKPVTAYIATLDGEVIGFGAYECTRRNYFGPTGVAAAHRKKGIGRALLVACLHGLREMGYAYGIVGGAGPVDFYTAAVGATVIPDSVPGIYTDMLKREQ